MKIAARLNKLLTQGISGNQTQLVQLLGRQGIKTTQSTVSRALKKINAVKGTDETGNIIYSLPKTDFNRNDSGFFGSLVYKIINNGHLIVIHTKPGTANTVAKSIDERGFNDILGTVAGDDTILLVPSDVKKTEKTAEKIRSYLKGIGVF